LSGVLPGLQIVSRSVLPPPSHLDVSDPSVHLAARHLIVPVVIFEALMKFNPCEVFVGEKLDHMALFNDTKKALFAGLIR
jgi:hypothetical protein